MAQIIEKTEVVIPSDINRMCFALAVSEAVDYGWITQETADNIKEQVSLFRRALEQGRTIVCADVAYSMGDEPWPQVQVSVEVNDSLNVDDRAYPEDDRDLYRYGERK